MKQTKLKKLKGAASQLCKYCGGPTRLIGSEPHPVEAKTDLLTYYCTACDEYSEFPPLAEARNARAKQLRDKAH